MKPFIWNDRRVDLRDGNFCLSRKYHHDDFDVTAGTPDRAVAGNVGDSPITDIKLDQFGLRLISADGEFFLEGDFEDGTARVSKILMD